MSFLRIQMGSVYPSDCLFSVLPVAVIIGVLEVIRVSGGGLAQCPICLETD